MEAVRQSFRPKHQLLILKCYPKFQKNVVDVKPNSSELSYLLYYASTRRSKVQKVGAFLEKKTTGDVYRGRIGNVQITLRILTALIDKTPRDLSLYAPYVLRILSNVLQSKDITMVEDTVPTFNAFCENQEVATLVADQALIKLYEQVVRTYAGLAAKGSVQARSPLSAPAAIKWRTIGLQAIRSVTASEAVSADGGLQLSIVVPTILENLYSEDDALLMVLYHRAEESERSEKELAQRKRMSMVTPRATETNAEADSATVPATTADADRLAEEEVGLLALQCLKQIFVVNNRGQIRLATTALLRFVVSKCVQDRPGTAKSKKSISMSNWSTGVMDVVTRWTPVQDRFIILVTTMEAIVRSPIAEENLEQQLVLVTIVDALLSSTINMIGLSVMDVLLGLIQHILLLLQLGGKRSNVLPHYQQTDAIDLYTGNVALATQPPATALSNKDSKDASSPSTTRQQLLARLQNCIGALANHIYYSDQIPDMITAMLLRLKPSPLSSVPSAVTAIENPAAAAQAISDSVNMQEDPNTDAFFSFGTARATALSAVRDILIVANSKSSVAGAGAVGRNRVSVQIWEGTQWLLRDEDRRVRQAYVDAILTWLRLEVSKNDLTVMEDRRHKVKNTGGDVERSPVLVERAASSGSRKGKTTKAPNSTFLELLHLAIYDNALESPEAESEILLLHLLLYRLVEKLGVNATKSGLPMIVRLQEDINIDTLVKTPKAKVNVGSLVHGYFWTLSERFDFDTTMVGYDITAEIRRRKEHGMWLDPLRLPPAPLDEVMSASSVRASGSWWPDNVRGEELKPFDKIKAMVDQIAIAYASALASPPASPPTSPGRVFSLPVLSTTTQALATGQELPLAFKEAMLSTWSKETCIASVENENRRAASLHGSRTGTTQSLRNGYLYANGHAPRDGSPAGLKLSIGRKQDNASSSPPNRPTTSQTNVRSSPQIQTRRASIHGSEPVTPMSSSDHQPVLRVDDLKRVLAGGALSDAFASNSQASGGRASSPLRSSTVAYRDFVDRPRTGRTRDQSVSGDSDSIVDDEGFNSAMEDDTEIPARATEVAHQPGARSFVPTVGHNSSRTYFAPMDTDGRGTDSTRPQSSSTASGEDPEANARALKGQMMSATGAASRSCDDNGVPPVPPLPQGLMGRIGVGQPLSGDAPRPMTTSGAGITNPSSTGRSSGRTLSFGQSDRKSVADALLKNIGAGKVGGGTRVVKPPY